MSFTVVDGKSRSSSVPGNNALYHQALLLVVAAMIYQVLTMVMMILWKPLMRKREEVSVEKVFSIMSNLSLD